MLITSRCKLGFLNLRKKLAAMCLIQYLWNVLGGCHSPLTLFIAALIDLCLLNIVPTPSWVTIYLRMRQKKNTMYPQSHPRQLQRLLAIYSNCHIVLLQSTLSLYVILQLHFTMICWQSIEFNDWISNKSWNCYQPFG